MRKRLNKGLFISLDGPEGRGKSTQAALLADRLREDYVGVILTREPGGTTLGRNLRELTLREFSRHAEEPLSNAAELLLMMADRAQHVQELIRPALEEGQIVISDRYVESTIAYQGWGRGWELESLWKLHEIATGNLFPDLTFLMEGEPLTSRGDDRFERLGDDFHKRVEAGYASLEGSRYIRVRANRTRMEVTNTLHQYVEDHIRKYGLIQWLS